MIVSVNFTHSRNTWIEGPSTEELFLSDWLYVCSCGIFSIAICYTRVQPTVGSTLPENVGLGYIRKVAEQARASKAVSNVPL